MMCAGVVASVFSPLDISNLYQWYDASDSSTFSYSSGTQYLTQWNDKSGNNFHATQSTTNNMPLKTTSPENGLPSVSFARHQNVFTGMQTNASAWDQEDTTVFLVIHKIDSTATQFLWGASPFRFKTSERLFGIVVGSQADDTYYGDRSDKASASVGLSTCGSLINPSLKGVYAANLKKQTDNLSGIDGAKDMLLSSRRYNSTSVLDLKKNNNAPVPQNTTAFGPVNATATDTADGQTKTKYTTYIGDRFYIGVTMNGISNNSNASHAYYGNTADFIGHIQEIIHYNKILSDQERNQVMGHLMGKWRITE